MVVGCGAYFVIDKRAPQRFDLQLPKPSDRMIWSDVWRFDRSYWYIVGLCVTFYSVIFPFRSTFAIKYFQHAHGLSLQEAGSMNAYVFLAAIFATPAFGLLADRVGHRAALMALGSLLLFAVFPLLAYTECEPVGLHGPHRHRVLARPGRAVARRSVSGHARAAGHGVRVDDDAAEHRDDAGQPRRGRVE